MKQSFYIHTNPTTGRHLYGRGWLGLIPLVGFFVGIWLTTLGLGVYKDKKLVLIGLAAILFTPLVYGSLFYYLRHSDAAPQMQVPFAQGQINDLVKEIEFYKLQKGSYPDSLEQLQPNIEGSLIFLEDPISSTKGGNPYLYNYKKIGSGYTLFSSGVDKIINTVDDIYPTLSLEGTGFIREN